MYIALDAEPKSEEDIATWNDFANGARSLITKNVADACFNEVQCIWSFVEFLNSESNTAEEKFESNLAREDFVQDLLQRAGSCSKVSESSALVSILGSFKYFLGTDFCVGPTDVPLVLIVLACSFHNVLHQLAADENFVAICDEEQTTVQELVVFLDNMSSKNAVALEGLVRAISVLTEQQEGCTRPSYRMSAMVAKVTARMTEHVRKTTGVYNGQINSHHDELENQAGQPALTSLREKWIAIDKVDKDVTD